MKFLAIIFISCSLLGTGSLLAQGESPNECKCKECKCSYPCGCYINQGCTCETHASCLSKPDQETQVSLKNPKMHCGNSEEHEDS